MLRMYTINAIVRISHIKHTRQRTRASLQLQGSGDVTMRLPFVIRLALTKCSERESSRTQNRHQHWSIRDDPPALSATFMEVNQSLEDGGYYSVHLVPNCTKSGLSQYAYYAMNAVKLEHLPEHIGHTIERIVSPSGDLERSGQWYDDFQKYQSEYVFKETLNVNDSNVDQRMFLHDFVLYISDLYTERPNSVVRPRSCTRQGRRKRRWNKHNV